ncbi:uncharacterized protein TRAVEDRAFT_113902 [Trametes versicolor FP-101664 SS1]|uniref:uncharacterized protein n=1 Tax=Trametes versicolor (strain FP-101664) TaxID=717944 RepID=UPI0004622DB8|nr:uncharacterized protein TRAVEDRAFT_113902 [Trametes versicolor FP-101664 SS1]EIW62480.1 hypothetical protein TRAVEDRAFT_113902 [Trametes versicolor FP-101664 SS1]
MLPALLLSPTLLLPLLAVLGPAPARAGDVQFGGGCNPDHQKLQEGTFQFQTDCDAMTFCFSGNSTCAHRGCRQDEFPFGYSKTEKLPDRCPKGQFCPDEQDLCQPLLAVGSACQFNRDDECEGPPNSKELEDTTGFGLNSNGSVCLNNICMWANVTVGLPCIVQNTAYTAYGPDGEFIDIVSRQVLPSGNCKVGLYCDAQQLVCVQGKAVGDTCDADKECLSYNCLASGTCGDRADTPREVAKWVYVVVAICIFGGIIGTLIGLYFIHRKDRDQEREKRMQYWREQNAFRQNIMQMQETARNSLMNFDTPGTSPRSTMYGRDQQTEDSQAPMLHQASKSSALRYYVSDDGSQIDDRSDEDLMMRRRDPQPHQGDRF